MEALLAAWLPPLVALALSFAPIDGDLRRAIRLWFVPLALLWFAPCWLTGSTPLPFDILSGIYPWRALGGPPGVNALINDPVFQFIPWREAMRDAVRHGRLPLLDDFAACGASLWTNPQAAVLYPLTWLGLWLSPFAWPLFAAEAKLLVAMTGMYVFVRRGEGSHVAAIAAAVAYAFGAFTIVFLFFPHTNVTTLLPWALVVVHQCRERLTWPRAIGGALVIFAVLAGGHPESALHAAMLLGAFALVTIRTGNAAARLACVVLAGVALALPLLLPFASILPTTERTAQLAAIPSLVDAPAPTLRNILPFVAPAMARDRRSRFWGDNFAEVTTQYVGIVTLALAVFACVAAFRRQRFWIAVFAAATLLAFKLPLISAIVARIPLLDVTLHGRIRFVIAFATAVLAARGIDLLPWRRTAVIPLVIVADLALLLGSLYPPVPRAWCYPTTGALAFLQAHARGQRVAAFDGALLPNSATMLGLHDIAAHDPTAFEPYLRELDRGGYDRGRYFGLFHGLPPRQMLDFLGVRYVAGPPDAASPLPIVYRGRDGVVFENSTAQPVSPTTIRARLTRPAVIVTNRAAIPGWRLTRNGAPWPLLPGGFLAWRAEAGQSDFALRYVPPRLPLALALAWLAIPLIIVARSDRLRGP